jgi:hypothetical protein
MFFNLERNCLQIKIICSFLYSHAVGHAVNKRGTQVDLGQMWSAVDRYATYYKHNAETSMSADVWCASIQTISILTSQRRW